MTFHRIHRSKAPPFAATLFATCLAASPMALGATDAGRTLRYAVISSGRVVGSEVDVIDRHGAIDSDFEYSDRGRGPSVHAHYEFAADGIPLQVAIGGVNYLKAAVDERFVTGSGGLQWTSAFEHGASRARGFYLSNDGVSGLELAALVGALQRRPRGAGIALLPAGHATLEPVADTVVRSHGESLHVRGFAIAGLDLAPVMVWVDDDGFYFGSPGRSFATLRAGWEDVNATLYALQLQAQDARYARLAAQLAHHPQGVLAIEHVRLFDAISATASDDQTVIIDGALIAKVGPAAKIVIPGGAERVNGRGCTLLPGLIDMHVHAQPEDGLLHIASGVTAVRDMGNDIDGLQHLQEQWDRGGAIGPRVWKAGLIDGSGPYQAPAGIYADTPQQVEAAVARYADAGYFQIKLYSSLRKDLVPVAIAAAHRRGMRLSGHVPEGLLASEFVRLGADELQHVNFVLLNFLGGKVGDTRTPERFTAVGEHAAEIDLASPAVRDFIGLLVERHIAVDVTVGAFEGMLTGRPGTVSADFEPVLSRLPPLLRRQAFSGGLPVTPNNDQRYREAFAMMLRVTKQLSEAGVPVLVGTDGLAGLMLHRELELHVQAGIPAAKVLQDATLVAARVLGQEATLGSITPGKRADVVLVQGNPLERIADIRRGRLVVKDGVVFEPGKVYEALGIAAAP